MDPTEAQEVLSPAEWLIKALVVIEVSPKHRWLRCLDWASVNGYDERTANIEVHGEVRSSGWAMKLKSMYRSWQSCFDANYENGEDADS